MFLYLERVACHVRDGTERYNKCPASHTAGLLLSQRYLGRVQVSEDVFVFSTNHLVDHTLQYSVPQHQISTQLGNFPATGDHLREG